MDDQAIFWKIIRRTQALTVTPLGLCQDVASEARKGAFSAHKGLSTCALDSCLFSSGMLSRAWVPEFTYGAFPRRRGSFTLCCDYQQITLFRHRCHHCHRFYRCNCCYCHVSSFLSSLLAEQLQENLRLRNGTMYTVHANYIKGGNAPKMKAMKDYGLWLAQKDEATERWDAACLPYSKV